MNQPRFEITRIPETEDAAILFIRQLDAQIDELSANLDLLQALRRAAAATFGVDRREGVGKFAEMADAARRAEYEGGDKDADGRLKVPGRSHDADLSAVSFGVDANGAAHKPRANGPIKRAAL